MAANLVIAAGSSALATALDTMPQWGPYLSAWLASLSTTSLRPGLFLFALGGGYLGHGVDALLLLAAHLLACACQTPLRPSSSLPPRPRVPPLQAMAWTLFSFSLLIFSSVAVVAAFVGHTTLGYGLLASAGATGLASEFLLMASLLTFECPSPAAAAAEEAEAEAEAAAESAGVALPVTERACRGGGSVQGRVGGVAWRAVAVRPAQWTERELFMATRSAREVAGAAVRGVMMGVVETVTVVRGGGERRGEAQGEGRVLLGNVGGVAASDGMGTTVEQDVGGRDDQHPIVNRSSTSSSSTGGSSSDGNSTCDSATSSMGNEWSLSVCEVLCAALLTAMAWAFAYCVICPGGYERSGRGERKWVQRIVMPLLEEAAAAYFHGISIVKEGAWRAAQRTGRSRWKHEEHDKQEEEEGCKEEEEQRSGSEEECVEGKAGDTTAASPSRPLIFTYHPHGLMPAVMAWFPLSSAFRALFPATRPVPLVASVCFRIPLARTYCLWGGVREVSRQGFLTALKDTGAAVLCPGGQSELTYHATNQSSCIALCARKIGFVRIAVQSNALLVPTLSFGEPHSFDNLFHWPSLQRFTYRRFGFPIPFCPVGLFGCLPLPRDRPMTLVMGRPFDPRSLIPTIDSEDPSYEDLCTIRDYYYAEVKALFDRHKAIHGFPHLTLELRK
ncbi:unnamed protein product [Closterium sp. Naga37s-1]|nr:unnamed protein product [Closterium sp. Naga37s-1]